MLFAVQFCGLWATMLAGSQLPSPSCSGHRCLWFPGRLQAAAVCPESRGPAPAFGASAWACELTGAGGGGRGLLSCLGARPSLGAVGLGTGRDTALTAGPRLGATLARGPVPASPGESGVGRLGSARGAGGGGRRAGVGDGGEAEG